MIAQCRAKWSVSGWPLLFVAVFGPLLCVGTASAQNTGGRDFVLAVDRSGSMYAAPKRQVLSVTGSQLVDNLLSDGDWLALIGFTNTASARGTYEVDGSKVEIHRGLRSLSPTTGGWTNIEAAKATAIRLFQQQRQGVSDYSRPQYLLLLTDGEATHTIPQGDPLYSMWSRERENLEKVVSFGKSGVTLVLFAYLTTPSPEMRAAIWDAAQEGDIANWIDRLEEETRGIGGNLYGDLKAHQQDGLVIRPTDPTLRNGQYVFDADELGVNQQIDLDSHFEVGYAVGELQVGLTELQGSVSGRLSGDEAKLRIMRTASADTEFTLSPRPSGGNAEAGAAREHPYREKYRLRIELPEPTFPITSEEELSGTLTFLVNGKLVDAVASGTTSDGPALPNTLPKPQTISFVARRPLNTGATVALVIGIVALLALAAAAFVLLRKPVIIRVASLDGSNDMTYRLGPWHQIRVGAEGGAMSYPLSVPYSCVIKRGMTGAPRVEAEEGRLYCEGMRIQRCFVGGEAKVGLGADGSEAPEIELNVSIVRETSTSDAGNSMSDDFDWPS